MLKFYIGNLIDVLIFLSLLNLLKAMTSILLLLYSSRCLVASLCSLHLLQYHKFSPTKLYSCAKLFKQSSKVKATSSVGSINREIPYLKASI